MFRMSRSELFWSTAPRCSRLEDITWQTLGKTEKISSQENFVLRSRQVHGKKCDLSLWALVSSSKAAGRCVISNFATLQTINFFLFTEKQECRQSEPNQRGSGMQFCSNCWCSRQIIKEIQWKSSVYFSRSRYNAMEGLNPFYHLFLRESKEVTILALTVLKRFVINHSLLLQTAN